jgi:hypothetical protein
VRAGSWPPAPPSSLCMGVVSIPLMTAGFRGIKRDEVPDASIISRISQRHCDRSLPWCPRHRIPPRVLVVAGHPVRMPLHPPERPCWRRAPLTRSTAGRHDPRRRSVALASRLQPPGVMRPDS